MSQTHRVGLRLRVFIGAVLATVLIACGLGAATAPAIAVGSTASITGTVFNDQPTGPATPANGGYALLYSATGSTDSGFTARAIATVSDTGAYEFDSVPAGMYKIYFQASASNASVWLGGTPFSDESTDVIVTSASVAVPEMDLPLGSSLSGTVTNAYSDVSGGRTEVWAYAFNSETNALETMRPYNTSAALDGTYSIGHLPSGNYLLRFSSIQFGHVQPPPTLASYWDEQSFATDANLISVVGGTDLTTPFDSALEPWDVATGRISGNDRFATSVAVSNAAFGPGDANVVFVSDGTNFPDALSASAAAAYLGGPLLLVNPGSVPAATIAEIERLQATTIIITGGTGVVSPAVEDQLAAIPGVTSVTRMGGTDRYDTSRKIADQVFVPNGTTNTVFLATGANYPDALVAGSAAGYLGAPLILIDGSASALDSPTIALLHTLAPKRIYLIGGTGSISQSVENSADQLSGVGAVYRLGGQDRFATSNNVDETIFGFADTGFVVNGYEFPDALSISAVAGVSGAPLYLSGASCFGSAERATDMGVFQFLLVGGTGVLDSDVENLNCIDTNANSASSSSSSGIHAGSTTEGLNTLTPGQISKDAGTRPKHGHKFHPAG